ncbi:hypothetical protein ACWC3X_43445 [Streptomyces populi]
MREEIDHTGSPLRQTLRLSEGAAVPRMVMDLSGVTFMYSSGINIPAGGWQAPPYAPRT